MKGFVYQSAHFYICCSVIYAYLTAPFIIIRGLLQLHVDTMKSSPLRITTQRSSDLGKSNDAGKCSGPAQPHLRQVLGHTQPNLKY